MGLTVAGEIVVQVNQVAGFVDFVVDVYGYYAPQGIVNSLNTLNGDVTLSAGTNVTITPVGQHADDRFGRSDRTGGSDGSDRPDRDAGVTGPTGATGPTAAAGATGPRARRALPAQVPEFSPACNRHQRRRRAGRVLPGPGFTLPRRRRGRELDPHFGDLLGGYSGAVRQSGRSERTRDGNHFHSAREYRPPLCYRGHVDDVHHRPSATSCSSDPLTPHAITAGDVVTIQLTVRVMRLRARGRLVGWR